VLEQGGAAELVALDASPAGARLRGLRHAALHGGPVEDGVERRVQRLGDAAQVASGHGRCVRRRTLRGCGLWLCWWLWLWIYARVDRFPPIVRRLSDLRQTVIRR